MSQEQNPSHPWELRKGPTEEIIARSQQDLIFTMKFIGESQYKMTRHFHDFIITELSRHGIGYDDQPFLQFFIDSHAAELRDFVFAGVSLTHQFRIHQIEEMLGDTSSLLRTDIWDALSNHIKMAEKQFQKQAKDIPALMDQIEKEAIARGQK